MKKFNRVLAMLLAIITVLAVLPFSALAEDWLNVETDKEKVENVTSTDITVTVDPKALLSYIQDGDIKGLIKGLSVDGSLGDILTKAEILAILPEEQIINLAKDIISDIDAKALLACVDADELLACVDTEGLISLLKDMDLKSYIKDINVLMNYIDEKDIDKAIKYIDTEALVKDYSAALMDLALNLAPEKLFEIVDINKAVKLKGIDVEAAANLGYIQTVIGYANLADKYIDEDALEAFISDNAERFTIEILGAYFGNEVANAEGLLNDGIITVQELIANNVISVDALAVDYGYANLVKVDVVKNQITAALNNSLIISADIVACLNGYTAAINTIGVDAVVNAIGGYKAVLNLKYITNLKKFITAFDVKAIAKGIIRDGVITKMIDAEGLIKAINVRAFVSKVDVKQLVKVVYATGIDVAQELYGMLDLQSYMVQAFNIFATMQQTITEIKIDGTAITTQNGEGFLKLQPARLIDALENLVPTLTELANIDDSGKLFTASFAISYLEGEVEKTKEINFNFVLTAGTDMIRAAAAKLSVLLGKVGYIDLANGKLVADITVPAEFASVLRIALESLADSTSPEMNIIKDKVLAAYKAQPNDFVAFAQELTLEEIVAVLEAVDPALFSKAYNKALTSRYAEVLISYVERVTGKNIADKLEVKNLVNSLATIPTFDVFVEKLESVSGIEITDHLPAKVNGYLDNTVYDVIDKLAEVVGYDFDMENLLKAAAASTDPFAYLYNAVVNKAQNAGGVYNFVKRNAIRVVNRLLNTRVGAVVADNCLMDFYAGNATFVFAKSVTFDARALVEKAFAKAVDVVASRVSAVATREEKLNEMFEIALDVILEETAYMTTGFDVTVKVTNLYRVTFKNNDGVVVLDTLLPVGTDLSKMLDYSNFEGSEGWVNVATGNIIYKMPAQDIVVKAAVEDVEDETTTETTPEVTDPEVEYYNVNLIVKDGKGFEVTVPMIEGVEAGTVITLNKAVWETAANKVLEEQYTKESGYTYGIEWVDVTFDSEITVNGDINVVANITAQEDKEPDEPEVPEEPKVEVDGLVDVQVEGNNYVVIVEKNWNDYANGLSFKLPKAFLTKVQTEGKNLVLTAAEAGAQKVTISNAMLATLVDAATGDTVTFTYKFNGKDNTNGKETIQAAFDGVNAIDSFGNGVQFVLPFAGKSGDNEKTFVYVDADAVAGVTVENGMVTFYAPHFSTITLVNKYRFIDDSKSYLEPNGTTTDGIANIEGIANEGWYAQGETVSAKLNINTAILGYEYLKTLFVGATNTYQFTTAPDADGNFTFTMPGESVTAKHYAKASVYNVYYYVNGELQSDKTLQYTVEDYANNKEAFVQTILSYVPDGYANQTGWKWFGKDTVLAKLGQDISLFWVNDAVTKITVNFYVGTELVKSYENTIAVWRNGALANLKSSINSVKPGYVWTYNTLNGDVALTNLTLAMLITSGGEVNFYGVADNRNYHVYTDGNATADKTDATAGTEINVTAANKPGHTAIIKVYETTDGTTIGNEVAVVDGKFTMPASNVVITVEYAPVTVTYNYITVTVPAGSVLNATDLTTLQTAGAEMVLYAVERTADGALKLTYRYVGTMNEAAFLAEVNALIAAAQYATTWIVNGVAYNSEVEAMNAQLPEGAKIVGWTVMSQNVKVAVIEYTAPKTVSAWVIVCIVLAVLLLLALIALVYVLHVTDKIPTSWLTKACAAIVGVFFAFCMILAKATLKVLNFMGIKEEDILEELPEEEPVADIPAVIVDFEATEEVAEEVVEEVTEEVVEETTEEVAEETTEEVAEEVTEEVVEEATEEVVEEATEEVVEEATEEVVEEATEEVVEEATEEVVEEATEEVVEEATEEVAEEATEEVVEEATEEVAEEATEEVAEEATEEVAEEATEEVVEEATEE